MCEGELSASRGDSGIPEAIERDRKGKEEEYVRCMINEIHVLWRILRARDRSEGWGRPERREGKEGARKG